MRAQPLDVHGVPTLWMRQPSPGSTLGVVLPGYGYSCAMPALFFATELLMDCGADVLQVCYEYEKLGVKISEQGFPARLRTDVCAALQALARERTYAQIIVVGKSLGTWAMSLLLPHPDVRLAIWLTPLLKLDRVAESLRTCKIPSLCVIGTRDPHYDARIVAKLESPVVRFLILPEADHGLSVKGDALASVGHLERIIAAMKEALSPVSRGSA